MDIVFHRERFVWRFFTKIEVEMNADVSHISAVRSELGIPDFRANLCVLLLCSGHLFPTTHTIFIKSL